MTSVLRSAMKAGCREFIADTGEALVLSITLVAGGYPLFAEGKIAGGIGVGGGSETQDCEIAEYVVSVFNEAIK